MRSAVYTSTLYLGIESEHKRWAAYYPLQEAGHWLSVWLLPAHCKAETHLRQPYRHALWGSICKELGNMYEQVIYLKLCYDYKLKFQNFHTSIKGDSKIKLRRTCSTFWSLKACHSMKISLCGCICITCIYGQSFIHSSGIFKNPPCRKILIK